MPKDEILLNQILVSIVDYPEEVKIDRVVDPVGTLLTVNVNPYDVGRVIGKQGTMINAIRTVLYAIRTPEAHKISIKIYDPKRK